MADFYYTVSCNFGERLAAYGIVRYAEAYGGWRWHLNIQERIKKDENRHVGVIEMPQNYDSSHRALADLETAMTHLVAGAAPEGLGMYSGESLPVAMVGGR